MNESSSHHKFILLGASRGLGWATYLNLAKKYPEAEFLLVSRKISAKRSNSLINSRTTLLDYDFSSAELSEDFLQHVQKFNPTAVIYLAGGGPFGVFQDKKWSDHQWALNVNFLTPAKLLHFILKQATQFPNLQQVVFVGSAIAESKPDPQAASYCAGKHALKGLITTVHAEQKSLVKVKMFSPGYMETDLLPLHSWPRQQGLAETAENVALELIDFLN